MNQDELRKRTIKFQDDCGVKSKFICKTLKFDEAFFCRWKQGKKELNQECYFKLNQFLGLKGY